MNLLEEPIDVTVETIPHNGHIIISALVNDQRFTRSFIGYSVDEAMTLFTEQLGQHLQEEIYISEGEVRYAE